MNFHQLEVVLQAKFCILNQVALHFFFNLQRVKKRSVDWCDLFKTIKTTGHETWRWTFEQYESLFSRRGVSCASLPLTPPPAPHSLPCMLLFLV